MRGLQAEHIDALREAIKRAGSNSELSRKTGVSVSQIGRILSPVGDSIVQESTWTKLEPFIRPYMKEHHASEGATGYSPASDIPFVKRQQMANRAGKLERPLELAIMEKLPALSSDGLEKAFDYIRELIKEEGGNAHASPKDGGFKGEDGVSGVAEKVG